MCVTLVYKANNQAPPDETAMQLELKVWGYSLENVPDAHLAECFKRAFRAKRDDFMLKASAVLREWDLYREELVALATVNREHILMLPPGTVTPIHLSAFKARHNLPEDWALGDPYPPESDLYGVPVQRQAVWVANDIPDDPKWHRRTKKPWELYPNESNPARSMVNGREFLWWVDTCKGLDCPGYIIEHKGPGGTWMKQKPCPDHGWKLRGMPVEPLPTAERMPGLPISPDFTPTADEDAAIRASLRHAEPEPVEDEYADLPF